MTYPIKISVGKAFINELYLCEQGSYDDMVNEKDQGLPIDRPLESHTFVICNRFKTILEVRNQEEADDLYYAVCSGTTAITQYKFCCKVADSLRPYVSSELVKHWPCPTEE